MKALRLLPFLAVALVVAAEKVSIADLAKDPEKYHEKPVLVIGKVSEFKQKTSRRGNPYFNMKVEKDGKSVNVYGQGKLDPAPKEGDNVEVTGMYRKEKKVGEMSFKNEIDVTGKKDDEKTKNFGVKIKK